MAIASTAVWEIRTDGSDTNGGAYNPSRAGATTDYTYPTPQVFAYTDLVLNTTTTLSSASRAFVSADVGNHLRITGGTGFTVGTYEVISVASGVATVDRAAGTASSTGGTGNLGGALATLGMAAGLKVVGNTIWVRGGAAPGSNPHLITSGTPNVSGGRVVDNSSNSDAAPTRWLGYGTTRGDLVRPTVRCNLAFTTMVVANGAWIIFADLIFDSSTGATATAVSIGAGNAMALRVRATGLGGGPAMDLPSATGYWEKLEVVSCTSHGAFLGGTVVDSVFRNCGTSSHDGARISGAGTKLYGCVASGNQTHGFFATASGVRFINCTSRGNGGDGFFANSSAPALVHVSGLAYGNGGLGFRTPAATTTTSRLLHCAAGSNASGAHDFPAAAVEGLVALTADPFTDAAGLDFSPNNAAGGGALLRGAGWPQSFPGLAGASAPDIGAYQASGGGSSGPTYFAYG